MELQLKVRKIGNSLGIILPKKIAKELGISPGDEILIEIGPKRPAVVFGLLKGAGLDPEKAKVFKEDEKW